MRLSNSLGLLMVYVPLILNLTALLAISYHLGKIEREVTRQENSYAAYRQSKVLSKQFYDAGVAMGGYSITKSPLFDDRYKALVAQMPVSTSKLKALVGDDPKVTVTVARIEKISNEGVQILNEAKKAIDDNRVDIAQFKARRMYKEIRQLSDQMEKELYNIDEARNPKDGTAAADLADSRAALKMTLIVSVVMNILVSAVLLAYFSKANRKPAV